MIKDFFQTFIWNKRIKATYFYFNLFYFTISLLNLSVGLLTDKFTNFTEVLILVFAFIIVIIFFSAMNLLIAPLIHLNYFKSYKVHKMIDFFVNGYEGNLKSDNDIANYYLYKMIFKCNVIFFLVSFSIRVGFEFLYF